jgi:ADP-ribosylglycohydrolase
MTDVVPTMPAALPIGALPADYPDRVYAGVLGKIIGVYLGRPVEGWTYEAIQERVGDIDRYIHDRLGVPLVVTDDDITGTFTFVRAMADHGHDPAITARQIGRSWLDYLIEKRTILWWGGLGNSTEHTAYLRLKDGIDAPESGSIARNGQVVAEQIGAQIFIDGWAMLHPGDPEAAADLARRAAQVSHDGVAVHAAQVLAAMEAQAFVERDVDRLFDVGVAQIPADSIIRRLIDDIRGWRIAEPDWRATRLRIVERYGYDRYGGNVHVVPNHALMAMSLVYGDGDFSKTLSIVTTAGWDTDCNAGNIGALMGIRNGIAGIDAVDGSFDWRGPVRDRLFLPTAEGGRCISDAVREADALVAMARTMRGLEVHAPKEGARFHFERPGSVQGFAPDPDGSAVRLSNVVGHSATGERSLAIRVDDLAADGRARITTPTFAPLSARDLRTYDLLGSPTLYPGQTVTARVEADRANVGPLLVGLVRSHATGDDGVAWCTGPTVSLEPGRDAVLEWQVPDAGGQPILSIGLELGAADGPVGAAGPAATAGRATAYLDRLGWAGPPNVRLGHPADGGSSWRYAWVDAVDHVETRSPEPYRIMQDRGTGLLMQGTETWHDLTVDADVRIHMAHAGGIAVHVRGLTRWVALLLDMSGRASLVRSQFEREILAERLLDLDVTVSHRLRLDALGDRIRASIDGVLVFDIRDTRLATEGGAIALVCEEGRVESGDVIVRPPDLESFA